MLSTLSIPIEVVDIKQFVRHADMAAYLSQTQEAIKPGAVIQFKLLYCLSSRSPDSSRLLVTGECIFPVETLASTYHGQEIEKRLVQLVYADYLKLIHLLSTDSLQCLCLATRMTPCSSVRSTFWGLGFFWKISYLLYRPQLFIQFCSMVFYVTFPLWKACERLVLSLGDPSDKPIESSLFFRYRSFFVLLGCAIVLVVFSWALS